MTVPPSIHALLSARLDQLPRAERAALERGAVEGQVFHRSAVQALAPEDPEIASRLLGLVRKELVRPERAQLVGDDAFRFRHILIRDAAYDALPKATRAELHERFARWLDERGADLVELDEIVGYHLEQACRYLEELGIDGERARGLGGPGERPARGRRARRARARRCALRGRSARAGLPTARAIETCAVPGCSSSSPRLASRPTTSAALAMQPKKLSGSHSSSTTSTCSRSHGSNGFGLAR